MIQNQWTMMMNKQFLLLFKAGAFKKLFIVMLILKCTTMYGQKKDFGAWYSISARYEIINNLRVEVSEEVRTDNNASEIDQFFTDMGLNYKINKFVSVGGFYRFIRKVENDDEFYTRNRFYGEIELKLPFSRFELAYRSRLQRQINKYADDVEEKAARLHNRHKVSLNYNVPNIKLTPSIFYERFYRLKYIGSYFADGQRYGGSLGYNFNKRHKVDIGFLVDEDLYPNKKYQYVLTAGYRLNLK